LEELSRQGFVSTERRGERRYYKLRFRRLGAQTVRYVSSDVEQAAAVQKELDNLQTDTKILRELRAGTKKANAMLRNAKAKLEPIFHTAGWAFHGLGVRRPRRQTKATGPFPDDS
jgi:hypothetical protein